VTGIIKSALRNAADQWHLPAFKADADRTAGPSRLAFAAASARLAVATGFTLAQPFTTVPGSRTRFKVV